QVRLLRGDKLLEGRGDVRGGALLDVRHHLDGHAREPPSELGLELRRIGMLHAARAAQRRGGAADHRDLQALGLGNRFGDMRERQLRRYEIVGNGTDIGALRGRRAVPQQQPGDERKEPCHAASPASGRPVAGCGGSDLGPRASSFLYQLITHATATMTRMPTRLTKICAQARFEISTRKKCPANDRKMPRQKISSECSPQMMAGRNPPHLRYGQSRGMKRTVTSARIAKWIRRNGSRFVLSTGFTRRSIKVGISWCMRGKCPASVITMANSR